MKKTPYDVITERIIEIMEKGIIPWKRPWNADHIAAQNFISKKAYRGVNWLLLNSVMMAEGYNYPYFMTYKQAKEKGGQIIKGSKGYPVTLWTFFDKTEKGAVVYGSNGKPQQIPFLRYYTVFNADQIEGIEWPAIAEAETIDFTPIELASSIVSNWEDKPAIEHGGARACYGILEDVVRMPTCEMFHSEELYYSVLFHELGHSTGHKDRLNRDFAKRHGNKAFAYEELVAEMTACFLCTEAGISDAVIENEAAYIKSWISKLKDDTKMLVTASGAAQKASDMILNLNQAEDTIKEETKAA